MRSTPDPSSDAARAGVNALLGAIHENHPETALDEAEQRAARKADPAVDLSLAAIAAFHALQPGRAGTLAAEAVRAAGASQTLLDRAFAGVAGALALAVDPATGPGDAELGDADRLGELPGIIERADAAPFVTSFLQYQLAEAHLAAGHVSAAAALVSRGVGRVARAAAGPDDRYAELRVFAAIMRVRALFYHGRVSEAQREATDLYADLRRDRVPHGFVQLVLATRLLIAANADERQLTRSLTARLRVAELGGRNYLASGTLLLAAYGYLALGDVMGAARLVHRSRACGPLTIVDDAISLEILVSLAVLEQDPGAAEAWLQLAEASEGSRISQPSIHRMRSRVRLLEGDPERAIAEAERAAALAEREGRQIEAAEAEILTARARVAAQRPGEAAAGLSKLLLLSDASGHRAARRDAAIEMRSAGRRLGPALGDELTGLSARELDVAMLIAAGLSNAEIAATLFLSPHTVRAHVSRVLTAFGAASRLTVAARVGALLPAPDEPPPPLTGRQLAVAREVARGLGNASIATELGISAKTVEKHLTEIHRRWGVHTRTGVSRLMRTVEPDAARDELGASLAADQARAPDSSRADTIVE